MWATRRAKQGTPIPAHGCPLIGQFCFGQRPLSQWLLLLETSTLALKTTDDLTRKKKPLSNQRRLKFGCKSLPNTINFSLGPNYEKEKILAGTSEWVMTGMGQCSEILQVRQVMSLRKEELLRLGGEPGLGGRSARYPQGLIIAWMNGVSHPAFNSSLQLTSCVTVRKLLVLF